MVELEAGRARRVYGLSSVSIRTFGTVLEVFDLLIFALAGIVSGWIRFGIADFSGARELFLIVGIFVCVFAFRLFKLNDPSFFTHPFTQMQRATFAVLFVFAVTLTIGFITKMSSELSRLWVGYWLIGSLFALVGTRPLVTLAYNRLKSNGSFSRNFVIFGSVDQLDTLERFLSHWGDNAQPSDKILGVFLDRSNSAQLAEFAYADMITGTVDNFLSWGNSLKLHRAIIAVPANESDSAEPLLEKLRRISLDVDLTVGQLDAKWRERQVDKIAGVPTVRVMTSPLTANQVVVKRAEDLVLATAALLLLWPLMLLVAIMIKLDSPGPIIFKQSRHGFNNNTFQVLKFRTMYYEPEQPRELVQARRQDPRITRIGSLLRKSSIDELPQLLNVLRGEMSIVGPRPHAIQHNDLYAKEINSYLARHRIKPGITGWAQVNGYRGEIDQLEKMQKRVVYDLFYVDNWSFEFDLKILLMTFGCLVHPNAY